VPDLVERDAELRALVERAMAQPDYALDTEFHRERTYFPKLALVQLAFGGEVHLVDPLAVDIALLVPLLESDALAIVHAADQDLDVLGYAVGTAPARLFDTQVAAGFLGMSTPSLSSLAERLLDVRLPKGDRLTDWLRRPLDAAQLS
jgi:ribonuclease D